MIWRAPETLREGDGSELRVAKCERRTWARVSERSPERPDEDAEHGTRHLGRLVQEGPKSLGHGQHPLPGGEVRDHLVGQVDRRAGDSLEIMNSTASSASVVRTRPGEMLDWAAVRLA